MMASQVPESLRDIVFARFVLISSPISVENVEMINTFLMTEQMTIKYNTKQLNFSTGISNEGTYLDDEAVETISFNAK